MSGPGARVRPRWALVLSLVALLFATGSPAQAAGSGPAATATRTGMSWAVLGQQGGYVHVGADARTNAYTGDTSVDQYLHALCLLVDGQAAPGGIAFDQNNGWARGRVRVTAPVRGDALTSQQQGDALCATSFGAGWRLAEFHDGRYGQNFSVPGGWSFWAAGQLTPGTRFWVAINDQPANPWNSAGELPPPVVGREDDLLVKTRLQELTQPLLGFARDQRFRDVVTAGVARRFDGDDNVLLTDVITAAEQAKIVDTGSAAWQDLKARVAQFENLNGRSYAPQIYIPNYGDGAVPGAQVVMTVFESDPTRTDLPAYQLDANGNLAVRSEPVNEAYAETHEVWVLSPNERIGLNPTELRETREMAEAEESASRSGVGISAVCNPTGLRNNKGLEYLQKFRIPDPRSLEPWTRGKLEMRLFVVGKDGAIIKNAYFGGLKPKTLKNGIYPDMFLTTWDRAVWGDYLAYKWLEVDGGPNIEISLGLSVTILKLINAKIDVKALLNNSDDDAGAGVVMFGESTYITYSTGTVEWNVCSMGGDGGTGDDNLARSALAVASSVFPGYEPGRVNDGSRDTSVGGATSWANADKYGPNGFLPQWVQLDFGTDKTFSKVVLYTSSGYPIRDYDLQTWNGTTWVTVATKNGNTDLMVTHQWTTPLTSRLLRVYGRSGPTHQPQYVRVNELEVYR
ncbi:discoidin domain-containing protein [Goodfellowiella coeruleoviolacea]|uniref:F5/8 type C domain-containing protein n=1 Tax=Goodfellowiella coeruleoviolacea TaxID=334858 RepID=A0AAE3G952_9PSEU|nr:discoidin domain-containing protein [Goodfellowiella coeruleoviolacea]MCP2163952.1 F5/8 type C domain-containing protein [Goodfellowiella coeruleoviolacea]